MNLMSTSILGKGAIQYPDGCMGERFLCYVQLYVQVRGIATRVHAYYATAELRRTTVPSSSQYRTSPLRHPAPRPPGAEFVAIIYASVHLSSSSRAFERERMAARHQRTAATAAGNHAASAGLSPHRPNAFAAHTGRKHPHSTAPD